MPNFICRKKLSDVPHFTDGKVYSTFKKSGNGFWILCDSGHPRFILGDGKPSPHLVRRFIDMYGQKSQASSGFFERVEIV